MTPDPALQAVADALHQASVDRAPIPPIRERLPAGDIAAAYGVQAINTHRRQVAGGRIVGRKIGLTAKVVQTQLGVDQPDYGVLFADMEIADGVDVPWSRVIQPKVEAEIAFVLGGPLAGEQLTLPDLIRAIAYALPAIEIVDSRIADWKISIVDTIADNASSGLYVLGGSPTAIRDLDLRLCGMVMENRGDQVSVGAGLACLGNPLNAALWLARKMVENGTPLQAGEVILSGALGPMVAAKPGEIYEARIAGLGSVRAAFGQEA